MLTDYVNRKGIFFQGRKRVSFLQKLLFCFATVQTFRIRTKNIRFNAKENYLKVNQKELYHARIYVFPTVPRQMSNFKKKKKKIVLVFELLSLIQPRDGANPLTPGHKNVKGEQSHALPIYETLPHF